MWLKRTMVTMSLKPIKKSDFDKQKSKLKAKLIEQKVQKDPKILTNAYKDLLKEYDVDYKDSDIKKAENTILNPEKLKQQQSSSDSSSAASGLSS